MGVLLLVPRKISITGLILADTIEVLTAALDISYSFRGLPSLNSLKALARYSFFAVIVAPVSAASVGALALRESIGITGGSAIFRRP